MKRLARSIRLRLLAFALVGTLVAMTLAALGLAALFERHLERRVGDELDAVIVQLAGNLRVSPTGQLELRVEPNDPRFHRPLSGLYWQVRDAAPQAANPNPASATAPSPATSGSTTTGRPAGATTDSQGAGDSASAGPASGPAATAPVTAASATTPLRSRSLWDADLEDEPIDAPSGQSRAHPAVAPDGKAMLQHDRRLVLVTAGNERPVVISVAVERSELDALRAGFATDLAPGLALLGFLILAGAWFQVGAGLRPLSSVRAGLARIRSGGSARLDAQGPDEIAPLVTELNALLDTQEREIARARDRAADLAHGLRTPLTALAGDVERLRRAGAHDVADDVAAVGDQMRRIVERELARARSRHAAARPVSTALAPVAAAITRTLERTPAAETVMITLDIPADLHWPMPAEDIAEILGNLCENAVRAAQTRVHVSAGASNASMWLSVQDHGPNADPTRMTTLTTRGQRADQSGGAGLGLAIVGDILEAHGGELTFDRSEFGGLKVVVKLSASHA